MRKQAVKRIADQSVDILARQGIDNITREAGIFYPREGLLETYLNLVTPQSTKLVPRIHNA